MFVEPIHLFAIASRQAEWLSVRQKVMASNIANVNTPGYQARDVEPFSLVPNTQAFVMKQTDIGHVDAIDDQEEFTAVRSEKTTEITHSGNSVLIEEELRKGSEINREISLNTAIVRSFHRMMIAAVKGG
ncbi:MAG: flagellar basal-body rod protein FlgB [Candidatus Tokpelaia sp. JSC188]|nr:MAG: flagellar basal-body rod protein FlgB [Candidatus Tokpelaia sp. JSC188]